MITVYTDGAFSPRTRVGGWAWWVNSDVYDFGWATDSPQVKVTNNTMELYAVVHALQVPEFEHHAVTIVSDSTYVVRGLEEWSPRWVQNGWRTSTGEPVSNRDLWETLLRVNAERTGPVGYVHIRGHGKKHANGDTPDPVHVRGNDEADRLAVKARRTGAYRNRSH